MHLPPPGPAPWCGPRRPRPPAPPSGPPSGRRPSSPALLWPPAGPACWTGPAPARGAATISGMPTELKPSAAKGASWRECKSVWAYPEARRPQLAAEEAMHTWSGLRAFPDSSFAWISSALRSLLRRFLSRLAQKAKTGDSALSAAAGAPFCLLGAISLPCKCACEMLAAGRKRACQGHSVGKNRAFLRRQGDAAPRRPLPLSIFEHRLLPIAQGSLGIPHGFDRVATSPAGSSCSRLRPLAVRHAASGAVEDGGGAPGGKCAPSPPSPGLGRCCWLVPRRGSTQQRQRT